MFSSAPSSIVLGVRDELQGQPDRWFVLGGMGSTKIAQGKELKGNGHR